MASESGYSNQKKLGISQFKTIHNVGGEKFGQSVAPKALYEKTAVTAITVTEVIGLSGQVEFLNVQYAGHLAIPNDIVRISSGNFLNFEFDVISVVDANNFRILAILKASDITGANAVIMSWVTNKTNSDGTQIVTISPSPIKFIKDSNVIDVNEDTVTPANNLALPSQMVVYKDGVQYPISIDTGTPANTVGVPVILTGASGPINITAGDLNVQLTDLGANYDATRIGDGTNLLGINANNEAKVHDADVLTSVNSLLGLLPSAIGQQVSAASLSVVLSTEQEVILSNLETQLASISGTSNQTSLATTGINTPLPANATLVGGSDGTNLVPLKVSALGVQETSVASLPLPSGAATETTLAAILVDTTSLDGKDFATETTLAAILADTSSLDAKDFATETTLASILADTTSLDAKDFATETTLAAILSDTTSLDSKDFATETTLAALSAKLPAALGQTTMAASLAVTLASNQSAISTTTNTGLLVPYEYDEIVTTYVGATTDISTVVYKLSTVTVATLTMSYDGSSRLINVVRS